MDAADESDEKSAPLLDATLAQLRAKAHVNIPFIKGECDCCGEESLRLVQCMHQKDGKVWACAPCRDKYKLPTV